MSNTKLKNFRLGIYTLDQLTACMDDLGLMSEVQVVRVAVAHLYECREQLDVTKFLRELRRNESKTTDTASTANS